jgi:hypothetical protein
MKRKLVPFTIYLVALVLAAHALCAQKAPKTNSCSIQDFNPQQCRATATALSHNLSVYGQQQMYVAYANLFRYQFNPQVNSTVIAAASVPGGLAPSTSSSAAATANVAQQSSVSKIFSLTSSIPLEAGRECDAEVLGQGNAEQQKKAVEKCWNALQSKLEKQINAVSGIRIAINHAIRSVTDEQHCYIVRLRDFSQPILSQPQAVLLVQFAKENQNNGTLACYHDDPLVQAWPDADKAWTDLIGLQMVLNNLQTASGFAAWDTGGDQAAYTAMGTLITNLIAEVTSYATRVSPSGGTNVNIGETYTEFRNTLDSNQAYRDDLAAIATAAAAFQSHPENVLIMTIPLNPCTEWYGRGRTDTVSLQYTDVSVTPTGALASVSLGTNTCMPLSIASSGIGVTFLPNPVFDFVPGDNTGTQVIGKSADNDKSPLYAVFYNVKLLPALHSSELFASPGIGFTSSSNTTTTDLLAGLSLSLARRLLFITPSADIGRRDELLPGFTLNSPKGSLTTVPTRPHWSVNFMISISFGIGPS